MGVRFLSDFVLLLFFVSNLSSYKLLCQWHEKVNEGEMAHCCHSTFAEAAVCRVVNEAEEGKRDG